MNAATSHDVIIIGAGHNGLTTAAYLARAGLRVLVLERRGIIGGCAVTEELWPGFHVSRASYVAGLLRPLVVKELCLAEHGLRLLPRNPSSFTPQADNRGLVLSPDRVATCNEIRYFSEKDARRYPDYENFLERIAQTVEPLLDVPPLNVDRPRLSELGALLKLFRRVWRLGTDLPKGVAMMTGAAAPMINAWFESEPLRSTLATDAIIGAWAAPSTPGTGYVLLHHVMGETNGIRGTWAYARGGMGSVSAAIATAAQGHGAEIRCSASVAKIRTAAGRATGVVLEDGTEFSARTVVSSADPQTTLLDLLGDELLPDDVREQTENLDYRSPVMKINVALDKLPEFKSRPGAHKELQGTIHIGATSMSALEESFINAQAGQFPQRPMIEMTIPSTIDDSITPPGKHLVSLFVQHVPMPNEMGDAYWSKERENFADHVFALVDEVAPCFSSYVLHREILAPPDLERIFGITGGNIFHGAMTPDRLWFMRPTPAASGYRMPLPGLYLCGAGTHPGGGVMGAC
ncbi:MAG: NAD(P)/FAD-dependent oxidoreductase, partial [Gammaproteobacteria bacterium]|nr:NAD(P)/FAD-dependent oxidoreductase [Gammaproteobacteria bacterium]